MLINMRIWINKTKKKMIKGWYKLMKPLATHLNNASDKRYAKYKSQSTLDKAAKETANVLIKKMIHQPNKEIKLADSPDTLYGEELYGYYGYIDIRSIDFYLKFKGKKRIWVSEFNRHPDFINKVVGILNNNENIIIKEMMEKFQYSYLKPKGYEKTYVLTLKN